MPREKHRLFRQSQRVAGIRCIEQFPRRLQADLVAIVAFDVDIRTENLSAFGNLLNLGSGFRRIPSLF